MQFSNEILNELVAPNLSKLTKRGAKALTRFPNYFTEFLLRSRLGQKKYKPAIEALLTNFYRRVDFACVEYRSGRKRLLQYTTQLPNSNSETRYFRLAVSHFETCVLHAAAANKCGAAVCKILANPVIEDDVARRTRLVSNAIRHFDENVEKNEKNKQKHIVSPVWISDNALHCHNADLMFDELHKTLVDLVQESKQLAEMLR
jgi:hypothetical protein